MGQPTQGEDGGGGYKRNRGIDRKGDEKKKKKAGQLKGENCEAWREAL